eukprot:2727631-Rhodomonas_salina.1
MTRYLARSRPPCTRLRPAILHGHVCLVLVCNTDGSRGVWRGVWQVWFVFVTLTTTGYGDITPVSHLGRAAAICIMALGPILTAFITGDGYDDQNWDGDWDSHVNRDGRSG